MTTSRRRSGTGEPAATRRSVLRRGVAGDAPPVKPARKPGYSERWIYGRHTVAAALANPARRWRRLLVLSGQEQEAGVLVAGARAPRRGDGEPIEVRDRRGFATILPPEAVHQGLALEVEPLPGVDLDDVLQRAAPGAGRCVIVLLDGVTDPHNVGAVLRSAAAFGALAVVVAEHGAAPVTGALAKAASGALERVPLVRVVNLARTLDRLKKAGFWVCGLDETASHTLAALDLGERVAILLGAEGGGIRRLVREHCDHLARLATRAAQPTLNVSNAAAIALYELAREPGANLRPLGSRPAASTPPSGMI
jgi:23S rRNA (guanosine2251-2'-O)-methyltransferase